MAIELEDLSPFIGSIVHGIDLSDDSEVQSNRGHLRNALNERQVIFFRDQKIDTEHLVNLGSVFGTVPLISGNFARHPNDPKVEVLKSSGKRTGTDVWHTDQSFHRTPPRAACLLAVDVPPLGGDTAFVSMTKAYDSLDDQIKAHIAPLTAIHNWEIPEVVEAINSFTDAAERYARMRNNFPPLAQPVVRNHPETGAKVLFVNQLYTSRIVGVSRQEGEALLSFLTSLASVPEWQVRFHWKPGSVAVWDNHAVQHYAVNDYHPYPRLMHRVTVE